MAHGCTKFRVDFLWMVVLRISVWVDGFHVGMVNGELKWEFHPL